ncbi:MAG: PAS domain-containing protein [Thermodesulfovibrionia bacterium]|nr:PAS domain-containing protein [Thermodesulfovibrionia bacterium]
MPKKKKLIREWEDTGIIAAIGDPVSIQDTDFRILYQNNLHKNAVGHHVGEYCYKAYQNKDHVCEGCHLAMTFKDGKIHKVERSRITENGIMYSENSASPLRDSTGEIVAGIELVRDITERKLAEEALQKLRDELEESVNKRTAELVDANKTLKSQINERKKIEENFRFTEKELVANLNELKEANIALKVLLKRREEDKKEIENNILYNVKHLILPYLAKLRKNRSMSEDVVYLDIIKSKLGEIILPFSHRLSSNYIGLSPKEIQIANLIKDGNQDKDIMEILNISLETVKTHRKNIRKKLGIYGRRTNLRTFLTFNVN